MTALVAYPGPAGTHTAAAAAALFPSETHVAMNGFRRVAEAVLQGEAGYGVLPIESSLAGAVAETHDLLYSRALSIVGETVLPIRHQLAAQAGTALEEIRVVRSHPEALEQCRSLLAQLPDVRLVPAASTADAARIVARDGWRGEAAIASSEAVRLYGLSVVAADVGDGPASTRFVSIGPFTRIGTADENSRTALSFVTDHRPGALFEAIAPLARLGLDLVRLVSRPLPETPWRYRFDAVVAGHPLEPTVRLALRELSERTVTLRVVGIYQSHPEEAA